MRGAYSAISLKLFPLPSVGGFFLKYLIDILSDMEKLVYTLFLKKEQGLALSESEKDLYTHLVLKAKEARAYPHQSGFFVRTAGLAKDGTEYLGGNKEYGFSDAFIHGETAVLSGVRDATDSPLEAIAWYKKEGELVTADSCGRPCGNCRDILSRYCSPDLYLLNGNETGVVVAQLKNYLFDNFLPAEIFSVSEVGVVNALVAEGAAVDVYLPEELKGKMYGAALVTEDGKVWRGSHYTNVGYDSVTPVMAAILNWKNNFPARDELDKHLRLSRLVIAGGSEMINPFYRDRQAILELDEILRRYKGDNTPLRVEIIKLGQKAEAFVTDTDEWLPKPFSPGAFRMDDVMFSQLSKLIGKEEANKIFAGRSWGKIAI